MPRNNFIRICRRVRELSAKCAKCLPSHDGSNLSMSLTNRATRLELSQGHQIRYHSVC